MHSKLSRPIDLTMHVFEFFNFRYYRLDSDVKEDQELQSFVNELSADGTGQDGGNGQVSQLFKKCL